MRGGKSIYISARTSLTVSTNWALLILPVLFTSNARKCFLSSLRRLARAKLLLNAFIARASCLLVSPWKSNSCMYVVAENKYRTIL